METISVVVRIQSPRHSSWAPVIITPDLWGGILWIFLIKFKFREGISLFLYEILEFHMTNYKYRPVYKAWEPERNTQDTRHLALTNTAVSTGTIILPPPFLYHNLSPKNPALSIILPPPFLYHNPAIHSHFLSPKPPVASH